MFKSVPSTRFFIASTVLVVAACFVCCSTKSKLVGRWSHDLVSRSMGQRAVSGAETREFFSDNTGRMEHFTSSGNFKYTILDDGRVKFEFQGGQKAEGRLDGGNLILAAFGETPVVLYKE